MPMPARRRPPKSASINDSRRRWLTTDGHKFIHYEVPEGETEKGEGSLEGWGTTHTLTIISSLGSREKVMSIPLSEFTHEEIVAFQKFFNEVVDRARPVTELRDKKAREAFDEGDDSFYRLYRAVPRYTERQGQSGQHDKGDEG